MYRRRFVAGGAFGALLALAGCVESPVGRPSAAAETATARAGNTPAAPASLDLPVPEDELRRGAARDAIPAITDPVFGDDWSGIEVRARNEFGERYTATPRLDPSDPVIGVERGGEARAYPLAVLNWHEVVNDVFEPGSAARGTTADGDPDGPLLVTYCPLCGSGVTAVRRVDGQATTFGVSGLLYRNDLVMYDERTGSLWSQIAATAIRGPSTGETLELVPSSLTTWGAWREANDGAVVLRPPPESDTVVGPDATRDYSRNPYAGYESTRRIGIGGEYDDGRLHPKATVVGVAHGGVARAYPLETVAAAGAVNDVVGGLPVVVAAGPDETLVAYDRRVDGEALRFRRVGERHLAGGGSRWAVVSGAAVDGPHEGSRLGPANDASPLFFFAWREFHPHTEVYGTSR